MSRSRNIKPGFFRNEVLVQLPFEQRLLFIGLWTVADRAGRFEDRPTKIKMEIFPADNVDVDAGLQALHDNGFILRYSCNGSKYCQVLAWAKHQNPHCKESASTIPAPCEHGASAMPATEIPERTRLIPDSLNLIPDSKTSSSELKSSSDQKKSQSKVISTQEPTPSGVKEDSKPTPRATQKPSHEAEKLAALLSAEIRRNAPDYRITAGQLRKWAIVGDRILRIDHRDYDEVVELICWCQSNEFEHTNVLSMEKLRTRYDALKMKAGLRRLPDVTANRTTSEPAVCKTCGGSGWGSKWITERARMEQRPCLNCNPGGAIPQGEACRNSTLRKSAQASASP